MIGVGGSNREVLERAFEGLPDRDVGALFRAAFVEGDPEAASALGAYTDLYSPDVEIDLTDLEIAGMGVFRGREGLREMWTRWIEEWEEYGWTVSSMSEVGEHVVVDAEVHATGRSSRADVIMRVSQVWTFRDGKVIRWRQFKDRASALAVIRDP